MDEPRRPVCFDFEIAMTNLRITRSTFPIVGGIVLISAVSMPLGQKPSSTGAQVYQEQCAKCHGAKGDGGKGYSLPLRGKLSIAELGAFIKKSMPPGAKHCLSPDADKVASYIHGAFYSPVAQERNRPPGISMSRLTVRQFRNAIADLVGGYHPATPAIKAEGLRGQYFKGQNFNGNERLLDRVDRQVAFDFGSAGPIPEKFDPFKFSIFWDGSLLAPDSGEYEIVLKSNQSTRLWFDGAPLPHIDGWVKSINDPSRSVVVNLIGGRAYPIRIDFSKSTTGVDDAAKNKGKKPSTSAISLMWRRPNHALENVPTNCLFSQWSPPIFVVETPFPPDDRSIGFERGNTVSKAWDEATTGAALETARYVANNLTMLSGVAEEDPKRREKVMAYCHAFVEHAFGRPLLPEVEALYVTKQFDPSISIEGAVKRVVVLAIKSPRFLYRGSATGADDAYVAAANLSFGLWDTLPSPEQIHAVEAGKLSTREEIESQAEKMSEDPRAWTKLREFLLRWLKVDEVPDIVKNPKSFPDFDAAAVSDLRTSFELFLERTAWSEKSDYRELMLSQETFMNGRLAKIYGATLPTDSDFVALPPEASRAGVLTQPYLLSRFAYLDTSSPIHRGVLILRNLLGRNLQPPPSAFAPLAPSLHPSWTTRERVTVQTKPAACIGCHGQINPLGFTLERFDAIGRVRDLENGKPVDSSGSYVTRAGKTIKFANVNELANYIANSDEAQSAFIEKLFHHLVKQPVLAYGPNTLATLQSSFAENRYSIRKLMAKIVAMTATKRQAGVR